MYDWHDEEDRNDRDVISYTLRRYISIKPHEQDLLYSLSKILLCVSVLLKILL